MTLASENVIPDIYIAAAITSLLSMGVIGGYLFLRSPKEDRGLLGILVLVMHPMNALALYLVRMPLDGWLSFALGKQSEVYPLIRTVYAPITEEPAKLWPLIIPLCYRHMKSISVHRVALAIGLGFGVGEAWTVAGLLSKSPEIAKYPWYLLGGYMSERMMVCVMHAAFTASALALIFRHKRVLCGLFACMLLHFAGNLPMFLAGKNAFSSGQVILRVWVPAYFLAMVCLLAYLTYGRQWPRRLFRGKVRCPECKQIYEHPIFGVNLIHKRYERCPSCRHWHLVSAFDEENGSGMAPRRTPASGAGES